MNTLQIRIDEKTKIKAQKILQKMGLDMSTAVKLYFHQIIERKEIPFRIITENGLTMQEEKEILKASEEARRGRNITKPMNIDEAITYLRSK